MAKVTTILLNRVFALEVIVSFKWKCLTTLKKGLTVGRPVTGRGGR